MQLATLFSPKKMQQYHTNSLLQSNSKTKNYGLTLTPTQAAQVAIAHQKAIQAAGRIEFSGEIPAQMHLAFCDSTFINPAEYADILGELLETFYFFKNKLPYSDEELIHSMQTLFNGVCHGSLELLQGRELPALADREMGLTAPKTEQEEE